MDPVLVKVSELGDVYEFTLNDINVSLANAIRRTILSDIPIVCFYTETYATNQCNIEINTSRLHNEILKHRLSCIPVFEKDLTLLTDNYILELDIKNDTDTTMIVTTEQFRIKNKTNGNYLTKDETKRIFPQNPKTLQYIDFMRLRPRISDTVSGEQIKLTAEFSVHTAKENSVYNVVSKCSYGNTIDIERSNEVWEEYNSNLLSKDVPKEDIEFQKKNFQILDSQRYYKEDSFDFIVQTLGVYSNKEIVKKACGILYNKFAQLIVDIDSDSLPINRSETTMDFCFDVILLNEDYTIGKVLEYILYENYFKNNKLLSFCGFKKFHPHNIESTIRLAYYENVDKRTVAEHLRVSCNEAIRIFKKVYDMF
uniref:DNA-directed RNA polymerase RpoA/D/Rpb3-type domain-containing protein n=1 Tax=viral metagenome TaxID=1070528 RepID=A0A6C0HSV0_9ZZZZ